jgi:hypothetical protein
MVTRSIRLSALGTIAAVCVLGSAATAQDFFSNLFGPFGGRPWHQPGVMHFPFAREENSFTPRYEPHRRVTYSSVGHAWCVRSCDGRYFPISGPENQTGAASCNSFCPAAETKVVYGSSIEDAATENGKLYSELSNAFRYRNELVPGCSCNGRDPVGLAAVKIENDPTLRKGDIVAAKGGWLVAGPPDRRGASLNLSPLPEKVRERLHMVPQVAAE